MPLVLLCVLIAVPTLIVHGKRDRLVRFASAQRHAERIKNARLIAFDDGTHFTFITHRTEISAAVTAFLSEQP